MTEETKPVPDDKPNQPVNDNGLDDKTNVPRKRAAAATSAEPSKRPAVVGAYLVGFIAIAAVVALAYFGYQRYQLLQQQLANLQQNSQSFNSSVADLRAASIKQQSELLTQLRSRDDQAALDMQGLTDQLLSMNEALSNLSGQEDSNWLVDQAYYLLKIANNRIMFMQDIDTAIFLVAEADQLLGQIDDPDLFATRKKLNQDRQRLNATPRVDSTGLAIRVSALQSRISDLPMIQVLAPETTSQPEQQKAPESWYEDHANSLSLLSDQWFTVRYHGKGYTPVISAADEQKLRFAMLMTLQTIQYAIRKQ